MALSLLTIRIAFKELIQLGSHSMEVFKPAYECNITFKTHFENEYERIVKFLEGEMLKRKEASASIEIVDKPSGKMQAAFYCDKLIAENLIKGEKKYFQIK